MLQLNLKITTDHGITRRTVKLLTQVLMVVGLIVLVGGYLTITHMVTRDGG